MKATIAGASWLNDAVLQRLLAVLSERGEEVRIAGGAVRDAILGRDVSDIDVATTTLPDETVRRAEMAGFKVIPTGIQHGTVTVIVNKKPVEVTTLRADVETDGRHAVVRFGRDWTVDAGRRDFTINALYAEADGGVIDLVGGLADIERGVLRFIGDPELRIREDYLRILRFFRFFAWYGSGRPDGDGLRACARLKDGIDGLSAERVWSELKKLLAAPDSSRALLWMRQTGVLTKVLPESEKWGIDAIHALVSTEAHYGWIADPLLRLAAMVPPNEAQMAALAKRLKFSRDETSRMTLWAATPAAKADTTDALLHRQLYLGDPAAIIDRLRLALASARSREALDEMASYARQVKLASAWEQPVFPVRGADLEALGYSPGPELGLALKRLQATWIESGFTLQRGALLESAARPEG
jgi:poly(A) polymerase